MDVWFTENQASGLRISVQVTGVLERRKSSYQEIVVTETTGFGRMLTLDDVVQTTERDEFTYHEMICHVPMCAHPSPKCVLVVGGGDGGVVREVLRHGVERVDLVEIDEAVVELSKKYLPTISSALTDPRVHVRIEDGIKAVREARSEYDVIIVDSTDPVGPAVGLFAEEFFRSIHGALRDDGIFVAQTGSPFYFAEVIGGVLAGVRKIFPRSGLYVGCVPMYPGGLWSYTVGSKVHDPSVPKRRLDAGTRYYSPEVHTAAFALPAFVKRVVEGAGLSSDGAGPATGGATGEKP
ncbi:MAG: polyamine aminopropyltransferase [Firmicutes bacterium]|nr:polyamine aminopropyltransferase [Bacillota bacterium]